MLCFIRFLLTLTYSTTLSFVLYKMRLLLIIMLCFSVMTTQAFYFLPTAAKSTCCYKKSSSKKKRGKKDSCKKDKTCTLYKTGLDFSVFTIEKSQTIYATPIFSIHLFHLIVDSYSAKPWKPPQHCTFF